MKHSNFDLSIWNVFHFSPEAFLKYDGKSFFFLFKKSSTKFKHLFHKYIGKEINVNHQILLLYILQLLGSFVGSRVWKVKHFNFLIYYVILFWGILLLFFLLFYVLPISSILLPYSLDLLMASYWIGFSHSSSDADSRIWWVWHYSCEFD